MSARATALYLAMLVLAVAGYFAIRAVGVDLVAPHAALVPRGESHGASLGAVLLALALITVVARALGALGRRFLGQPPVIGEIVAGLLLGPSALGALAPGVSAVLLPHEVEPYLGILSKIGVVLFMFLVGLELDLGQLRKSTHATLAISHASMSAPFLLGAGLALWLYPTFGTQNVTFTTFSLFLGISMSVTAFPVLARILTDRRVQRTQVGLTALASAAVDDISAWCLLALVVGVANAQVGSAAATLALVLLYLAAMILIVRPLLQRISAYVERQDGPVGADVLAAVFVGLLLSAYATESLGIHALFGAFLLGALAPAHTRLAEQLRERIEDLVTILFLPAFFAFTGLRTQLGLVHGTGEIVACVVIVLVATLGKFGGAFAAARATGHTWRASAALGALMNTRGLMELVVLNIGLDLGVISPTLFAMLVIMALVTTFATNPLLDAIMGRSTATARKTSDAPLSEPDAASHWQSALR